MINQLTTMEYQELEQCESTIEHGLNTFVEVGEALLKIRDNRLYRQFHSTFEDYCRERWEMVASRARQLIAAAEAVENIKSVTNGNTFPESERQARPLVTLPPEQQVKAWQLAIETAPDGKVTANHVQNTVDEFNRQQILGANRQGACIAVPDAKPHVARNTGDNEWYTPPEYIEAARQVLGTIDLDPASSEIANKTVQAKVFYSVEDDGLTHDWHGNVWMNPPYAASLIKQFAPKLVEHVKCEDVSSAIVLVNNATETEWFAEMISVASVVVFPQARVRFLDVNGDPGAPLQGQAVIYIGDNPDKFIAEFAKFGWVATVYNGD